MTTFTKSHKILGLCAVLLVGTEAGLLGFSHNRLSAKQEAIVQALEEEEEPTSASFTFAGVGDNLIHEPIYYYKELDTGGRDFTDVFEGISPYLKAADLAYLNLETPLAGDAWGLSGYPNFNGPAEMFAAIDCAGFNWLSLSSNHSLDRGAEGMITQAQDLATNHSSVVYTGGYQSQEDADAIRVTEINGIKVGLASFTYGLNGYVPGEGYEWCVDVYTNPDGSIDYDFVDSRIDALNASSDVQIVSVHWGDEYSNAINAQQQELASYLHAKGVEVIIGTHPHVIQKAEMLETADQQTLVYYSLGNFVSAQDEPERMVGAMASFQLNYDFETGKASFANAAIEPTVTWISSNMHNFKTVPLSTYTEEMAASHYYSLSPQWVSEYAAEIFSENEGVTAVV